MCKAFFLINYIYDVLFAVLRIICSRGREMSDFIWYWNKGNKKVFTKNTEVAEKAMRDGIFVMGKKIKPNIIRY